MVLPQAAVGIPGPCAAVGAVEDLDEPDAALDQPPGREAHLAEAAGVVVVQAIEAMRCRRLVVQVDDLGHGRLHAEGQLVRLDPGRSAGSSGYLTAERRFNRPRSSNFTRLLFVEDIARRARRTGAGSWDRPKAECRRARGRDSSLHGRPGRRSNRQSVCPAPRTGASRH